MAMLFGLLLLTLFPIVFAQAKNYSLSPEEAERSSQLYGQFSSQLNETVSTESTSHTTGHIANHTSERRSTQSARKSSDLAENSQKMRVFWDHTDGNRSLTSTMSHAKSSREYPSSRNDDPTKSGVTLDNKEHHQSTESSLPHSESTQMSGDDLSHTDSQPSSGADSIRSTGILPYDTKNKKSTKSPPNKSEDVLITGNRTVYQSTDAILDLTTISQSTGIPDGHTKDSENIRDLESHTESTQYVSTLGNHDYLSSSTEESITSTTQKPTEPPISKVFFWISINKGHRIIRTNIGLCSYIVSYRINLSTSYVMSEELWLDPSQTKKTFVQCQLTNYLPEGYYVSVTVDQLAETYDGNFTLTLSEKGEKDDIPSPVIIDSLMLRDTNVSMVSTNPIYWRFESHAPFKPLFVTIHTFLQKGPYIRTLPFFKMSATVSYVTSPGFNEMRNYPHNYDGEFLLKITNGESLVVSFSQFFIEYVYDCLLDYVLLTEVPRNKTRTLCGRLVEGIKMYHSSLRIYFHTNKETARQGFKIMFSVLPRAQEPKPLPGNVFNCSVPHFHRFEPLLNCNMLKECEGGEDERNCTYHSKECGDDNIDAGTKCYRLVRSPQSLSWLEAQNDCSRHGQNLITFTTAEEYVNFRHLLSYVSKHINRNYIGIQTGSWSHAPSVMKLYENLWQWVSGGTAFFFLNSGKHHHPTCIYYDIFLGVFHYINCDEKRQLDYFCEFEKRGQVSEKKTMQSMAKVHDKLLTDRGNVTWKANVIQCPLGHATRDFQACDSRAECFAVDSLKLCEADTVKIPMFTCQQNLAAIHYSLVCDHKQHCSDNSDEDFCTYSPCAFALGFLTCRNGQCFRKHQLCDGKINCYDGTDEACIMPYKYIQLIYTPTLPPGSVYLDGAGSYSVEKLESNRCPATHFACPNYYCLPVYLLCNGIEDCPGREDEAGCDSYTCPGFYRCRGSKVCLHADNVCDGVPQCPEQDDELLCDLSCPDQCHCQGLAFVCRSNFSVRSYPEVRYVDASGSCMTPVDFTHNMLLIHLRLSNSGIKKLPTNIAFPNLQVLDLSWNKQTHLDIELFRSLKNLRALILTGNPLIFFIDSAPLEAEVTKIVTIDLSQTNLEVLNGSALRRSPGIKVLNTSWSKLTGISEEGFQFTPKLEIFDTRGCPLTHFPNELLSNLHFLKYVYSDNFKLCCEVFLPAKFNLKNCQAVQNSLASCEDLLRSNVFRVFLWIFASLSLLGNLGCFVARLHLSAEGKALSSFSVFVTSLSIADFFMGVYLAIVGSADLLYQGVYVFRDTEWRNSAACKIAGFMSLLSSEVSALMICIITLDRFLVLRFPFSRLRFSSKSALISCGFLWLVGVILASVPLLPMTSHWEFYSQTGICVPLPFASRDGFLGYDYSFSVMILLNLVLFLLIAVGQSVVYWSVRTNSMSLAHNKSKEATIARRLIIIVVSDFLCWFPIGLLGLMSATGTSIPGEVNVAMAIFVLPFNSALNPFLYTFNLLMERRAKNQESRMLKRLDCRLQTELSEDTALSH